MMHWQEDDVLDIDEIHKKYKDCTIEELDADFEKFKNDMVNDMYLAHNKSGYLCAYDKHTHKCVDVIVSTGDKPLNESEKQLMIGKKDPKFEN